MYIMMNKIAINVGLILLISLKVFIAQASFNNQIERLNIGTEIMNDSALISEGDREFLRLKDKYADYILNGKTFYKVIDGKLVQVESPANLDEYNYYCKNVFPISTLAQKYSGWMLSYAIREYAIKFDKMMRERFPNKELTEEEFKICYDPKSERDSLAEVSYMICVTAFGVYNTNQWEKVFQVIREGQQINLAKTEYEKEFEKIVKVIQKQEVKKE